MLEKNDTEAKLASMRAEITELRGMVVNKTSCTVNTNSGNTVNTVNNIQIVALGREDVSGLSKSMLDSLVRRTSKGLVDLADHIRFDASKPQNLNIRADPSTFDLVEFYDGKDWKFGVRDVILKRIIEQGHEILQEHYDDNMPRLNKTMSHSLAEHVNSWLQNVQDTRKDEYKDLLKEMHVMILNRSRELAKMNERIG